MGIKAELKSISKNTLEILLECPEYITDVFFMSEWLPESYIWQEKNYFTKIESENIKKDYSNRINKISNKHPNYDWTYLKKQFITEWKTPALDFNKWYRELTYLLAGYIPCDSEWIVIELQNLYKNKLSIYDFLPFNVIENSEWDGKPLVNAIGTGTKFSDVRDFGGVRCLTNDEVGIVLDGLIELNEEGFKNRYYGELNKELPCPYFILSEEEEIDWLTDYFRQLTDYYNNAYWSKKSLLLYLT